VLSHAIDSSCCWLMESHFNLWFCGNKGKHLVNEQTQERWRRLEELGRNAL
jgi:hypothetical protein